MKSAPRLCAALLGAVGATVLVGWIIDARVLRQPVLGFVPMNPLSALCFIACGVSLWLSVPESASPTWKSRAAAACALAVAAFGFLKCGNYLWHWNFSPDQALFVHELADARTGRENIMAPNTALNFFTGGLALAVLDWKIRRRWQPASLIALALGLMSLLAVLGYLLNSVAFYRMQAEYPMALHSALSFIVLSAGIILARPNGRLMRLLADPGAAGTTLRRLLPAALIVPVLMGVIRISAQECGLVDLPIGVSLMTVATIAVFATLVFLNAMILEKAELSRREAEEKIQQLNAKLKAHADQLEAANRELEAFSYSVSHDLRAPLRAVNGFSSILLDKYANEIPDDARRLVNTIVNSARQMGQLIDDLLRLSRLSRQSLVKKPVSVGSLAKEVLAEIRREAPERRIEARMGDLPDAMADPSLLRQVLVNLLSNACKFSRHRTIAQIEVGCRNDNGEKVYYVRDNGAGFNMQFAKKLFGVFQRLHSAEQFEGTGVGLSIAQRIVQRHGGRIWAEAEVEKGATFYFTLPG